MNRARFLKLAPPFAGLLLADAFLFWPFLLGQKIFIGNPDRFNAYLPILFAQTQAAAHGQRAGWSDAVFGGLNTVGVPWNFPSGIHILLSWISPASFLAGATWLAFTLFLLSGILSYLFLHSIFRKQWVAWVGAFLYQTAFASTLRITQNDPTFLVLLLIPFLLLMARESVFRRSRIGMVGLFLGSAVLVWFCFLQEAAYALILLFAYLLWLAATERRILSMLPVFLAPAAGIVTALPRLYAVGREMSQVIRLRTPSNFDDLFEYQNIRPWEFLRFFDDKIFGRFHSEAILSNVNFSEGFQLFTAQVVPFLLLLGVLTVINKKPAPVPGLTKELIFFSAIFLIPAFVIAFKGVYFLLFELFDEIDFYHARIGIIALAPLSVLVSWSLSTIDLAACSTNRPAIDYSKHRWLVGLSAGALVGAVISKVPFPNAFFDVPVGAWKWTRDPGIVLHIRQQSLIVIALTGAWVAILGIFTFNGRSFSRVSLGGLVAPVLAGTCLAQSFLAASFQLHGFHTDNPLPFYKGDSWHPVATAFRLPNILEVNHVRQALETDRYRSVVVSQEADSTGIMANSIGFYWNLRLLDGYAAGVPKNLAWLPWGKDILRLRQLEFDNTAKLPWRLLALCNVKYALLVDRNWFNLERKAWEHPSVLSNPFPVIPRVFFPRSVHVLLDSASLRREMLLPDGQPRLDLERESFVVSAKAVNPGGADDEIVSFELGSSRGTIVLKSSDGERFLVLNERWHPAWSAYSAGKRLSILETNGFMMGIPIGPGASNIRLEFHPLRSLFERRSVGSQPE